MKMIKKMLVVIFLVLIAVDASHAASKKVEKEDCDEVNKRVSERPPVNYHDHWDDLKERPREDHNPFKPPHWDKPPKDLPHCDEPPPPKPTATPIPAAIWLFGLPILGLLGRRKKA